MKDSLLSQVQLKALEEVIAAARDTIRRHRRRYLQRNQKPCPQNCKGVSMLGREIVGCTNCGSLSADKCLKESKFVPVYTKEELAQQFADQLRNPEILLREYRDITVFLWVLGAFDKQKKTLDETIVEKVEQSEDKVRKMAANSGGSSGVYGTREHQPSPDNSEAENGTDESTQNFNR